MWPPSQSSFRTFPSAHKTSPHASWQLFPNPTPSSRRPHSSIPINFSDWKSHINRSIQFEVLYLASYTFIMFFGFIHVAYTCTWFLQLLYSYFPVWIHYTLFIHIFVNGYLDCSHLLVVMKNDTWTFTFMSVWAYVFTSFR